MEAKNQVAIVTGASSGIGKAAALALAAAGMALGLVGRDGERLETVCQQARRRSPRVEIYKADLSLDTDIGRIESQIREHWKGIDVLIHSAGLFRMGPVSQSPVTDLDLLYRVNVRAPFAVTQALLPLICSRQGQIVFVNSSVGLTTRANIAAYAATKHALKAFADSLRAEVNASGVRVLTVYPGRTATPQQERICQQEGKQYAPDVLLQPEDVATAIVSALSLERTAEITDINIRPLQKS